MKVIDVRIAIPDDQEPGLGIAPGLSMPELGDWIAEVVGDGLLTEGAYFLGGNIFPLTLPARVSIRPSKYREQPGFTVSDGRSSIFTTTRESAERIRDRLKRGEDTREGDFA